MTKKNRSIATNRLVKKGYYLGPSKIQGTGVFTRKYYSPGETIDIGIKIHLGLFPQVTPYFGSYLNHSWESNTYLEFDGTNHAIKAKMALEPYTELTMDYRDTPWYIMGPSDTWK